MTAKSAGTALIGLARMSDLEKPADDHQCLQCLAMVTGQRAAERRHDYIGVAHMADAIVDRLLQGDNHLNPKG